MLALATALFLMKSWFFSVLIENHLEFWSYCWFYGKPTHLGISLFDSCEFGCVLPMSVWQSYPKPIFPKNTPSYAHKYYPTIGLSDLSQDRIIRFGGSSPNRAGVGVKGSFERFFHPRPSLSSSATACSPHASPASPAVPNSGPWPDLVLLLPGNPVTQAFSSMDEGNFFSLIS